MKVLRIFVFVTLASCLVGCRRSTEKKSFPTESSIESQATDDDPLPRLVDLPEFHLTNQDGDTFGSDQLSGKVWIANFMFTRCSATCPVQTANMATLQRTLAGSVGVQDIVLLSITVDPDFDTPAVLNTYAGDVTSNLPRWEFLTGERNYLWTLCKDGFKLPVSVAPAAANTPILHSSRFILVDRDRHVRGLYDGTDQRQLVQLRRDVKRLIRD